MSDRKRAKETETSGTEITRFNSLRHGVLSRYTVLPWEDADEYNALVRPSSLSMLRRARPRSIWSRKWPASFGGRSGCDWRRLPTI
jgi:hypothetical protein